MAPAGLGSSAEITWRPLLREGGSDGGPPPALSW
eukprot:SAG31_NODE_28465_length_410_cov_0.527331_1_plen_33_part_10